MTGCRYGLLGVSGTARAYRMLIDACTPTFVPDSRLQAMKLEKDLQELALNETTRELAEVSAELGTARKTLADGEERERTVLAWNKQLVEKLSSKDAELQRALCGNFDIIWTISRGVLSAQNSRAPWCLPYPTVRSAHADRVADCCMQSDGMTNVRLQEHGRAPRCRAPAAARPDVPHGRPVL